MKTTKLITGSLAAALISASGLASAELSGNVGASSDYLWRGLTQTNHQASISGGLDYSHAVGIYAGAWASPVDFSGGTGAGDTEVDVYAGYAGETAGFSYDLGYIKYHYPAVEEDFDEAYLGLGYKMIGIYYANDSENDNSYASVSLSHEVMKDLTVGLEVGSYMFDDSDSDYQHYNVSVSKPMGEGWDASMMVSDTDMEEGAADAEPTFVVSFSKGFSL